MDSYLLHMHCIFLITSVILKNICNYNEPIQSLTCKYQIIKKILWKLGNRQRDHCLFSQGHTMTLQAARSTHLPLTSHLPFISIFDSFDVQFSSAQLSSVAQSCLTLCNPIDGSTPGLPVHHQFLEFTQTHVHWVSWCHPTSSSSVVPFSSHLQSFPASGFFQINQFFASGGQSIGVSAST